MLSKLIGIGAPPKTERDRDIVEKLNKKFRDGHIFINSRSGIEVTDEGLKKMREEYESRDLPKPIMGE